MRATAHRDTDVRGKKLADLHSDIEQVHKTASSGGDIRAFAECMAGFTDPLVAAF